VSFERFTLEGLSNIPGNVKLWESPGTAGGLPWINYHGKLGGRQWQQMDGSFRGRCRKNFQDWQATDERPG